MPNDILKTLILWGPTLLFILIIVGGCIWGMVRGFRKSFILFFHMIIAATISLCLFIWFVNSPQLDEQMVTLTNNILGNFQTSLQQILDVDSSLTTLNEMLLQKLLSNMDPSNIIYSIISDNGAYIVTLVEMAYRIILFILSVFAYLILVFVFYLVYLIAYPVRRKIRRHNKRFRNGEVASPYKKRRLLGGVIGTLRGVLMGIVIFSFLGTLIFVVTGGTKLSSRDEISENGEFTFGNEEYDKYYDYYSYVCEMGDTGIFKILNNMKDFNNTPYYFYLADLVLQGGINVSEFEIVDKTFYFRDETGYYISFCKDMINLLLKYGGEDIKEIINGTVEHTNEELLYLFLDVCYKEGFSAEFDKLITGFEGKTYYINVALSALTSLVNNIDKVITDEKLVGLIQCMFYGKDGIKVTDIATSADVKLLFKSVINAIAVTENDETLSIEQQMMGYTQAFVPSILEMSFFKEEDRRKGANKMLASVYSYCAEVFFEEDVIISEIPEELDWVSEFELLIESSPDVLTILKKVYDPDSTTLTANMFVMFEGEDGEKIEAAYDSMLLKLSESHLLDVVLRTTYIGNSIDFFVQKALGNNTSTLPQDSIQYRNSRDSDGNIIYGDFYIILNSMKYLFKNNGAELYELLINNQGEMSNEDIKLLVSLLTEEIDENHKTILSALLESKLLHYGISVLLSDMNINGLCFYLSEDTTTIIREDGKNYKIVNIEEIELLFDVLVPNIDILLEMSQGTIDIASLLTNDSIYDCLDKSTILQGTIVNQLIISFDAVEFIVLPKGFNQTEAWLEGGLDGEIRCLLKAIRSISMSGELDLEKLLDGNMSIQDIFKISNENMEKLFSSKVLRYSISSYLTKLSNDTLQLLVPLDSLEEIGIDIFDQEVRVISKSDMIDIVSILKQIITFDEQQKMNLNIKRLFELKEVVLDNKTLHTSLIATLVLQATKNESMAIPQRYIDASTTFESQELDGNVWFGNSSVKTDDELYIVLTILESSLGEINEGVAMEDLFNQLTFKESVIDDISKSAILSCTISKNLLNNDISLPVSVYQNELIAADELKLLFEGLFDLIGTIPEGAEEKVLAINDFSNINLDTLNISKITFDNVIKSDILATLITQYIMDVEQVVIPKSVTQIVSVITKQGNAEKVVIEQGLNSEFNILSDSLFALFGKEVEGEIVLQLSDFSFDTIEIKQSAVSTVLMSKIMISTISKNVLDVNQLVVPTDTLIDEQCYQLGVETQNNAILEQELSNVFSSLFLLFGTKKDNEVVVSIGNVDMTNFILKEDAVATLLSSNILSTTLSKYILEVNELTIPTDVLEKTSSYPSSEEVSRIEFTTENSEMKLLLNALFKLIGTKNNDGILEISVNNIDVNNIKITKQNSDSLSQSHIMTTTISKYILEVNELIIPTDVLEKTNAYPLNNEISRIEATTENSEMRVLLNALLQLVGTKNAEGELEINVNGIDASNMKITEQNSDSLIQSRIISTTLSKYILAVNELTIPTDVLEKTSAYPLNNEISRIEATTANSEMQLLLNALFKLIGTKNNDGILEISVNNIDVNNIKITEQNSDSLIQSRIMTTTISKYILEVNELTIPTNVLEKTNAYPLNNEISRIEATTENSEMRVLLNALFVLIGTKNSDGILEISINNIDVSSMVLSEDSYTQLIQSQIISTTISVYILDVQDLIIPLSTLESIEVYLEPETAYTIKSGTVDSEMDALLRSLFELVGTDSTGDGVKSIQVNSINVSHLTLKQNTLDILKESEIIASTISKKILDIASLKTPVDVLIPIETYKQVADSIIPYGTPNSELDIFLDALFNMIGVGPVGEKRIDIQAIDATNLELKESTLEKILASSILRTTISIQLLEIASIEVPQSVVEPDIQIYNSVNLVNTIVYSDSSSELYKLLNTFFILFGTGSTDRSISIHQINLEALTINSSEISDLVTSSIMSATISRKVLELESVFEIPSNVIQNISFYKSTNKDVIEVEELEKLLKTLFVVTNTTESLNLTGISIDKLSFPTKEADVNRTMSSLIMAATFSSKVQSAAGIIVPDEFLDYYTFAERQSAKKYIVTEELSMLILSVSSGLGLSSLTNINMMSLSVPDTVEKRNMILASGIMRATITNQVFNNTNIFVEVASAVYDKMHFNSTEILVLSSTELSSLMNGITKISNTGRFDSISLDLTTIMQSNQKGDILSSIAESAIYRGLISLELNRDVYNLKLYQTLITSNSSIEIDGTTYYYKNNGFGNYYIQPPQAGVEVYSSFEFNTTTISLFTAIDIKALAHTSLSI